MPKKIPAPSPPFIAARWHGGSQTPKVIVIHGTVSPCQPGGARAVAHFFATEGNPTSAHYVVDPGEVIQAVGDHTVAYHCGHNQDSIGVELCDPQAGPDSRWSDGNHDAMLARAADLVAQLCLAYDIPIRRIGPLRLRLGRQGICGHVDMTNAFHQSTHTDPGAGFPWKRFIGLIKDAATNLSNPVPVTPAKPKPKPKPVVKKPTPKPAAERLAIDYSYARPDPTAIKAAGYRGVIRYVSSVPAKNLTSTEATALRKAGLWIALVFEESAQRASAGAEAGRLDAGFAEHQADLLGYPKDAVIFYAVDYDATPADVVSYFQGIRTAAKRPIGVYGGYRVIEGINAAHYWQTVAWSSGHVSSKANWLQRTSHSHNIKGSKLTDWDENLLIGGKVPVWNANEKPTPPPVVPPLPPGVTVAFGTANIQNLPNLTADQVLEDVATVYAHCDVVVWQEIAEVADQAAIDTVFPPADWWHLFPEVEVPISIRRSKFEAQASGKIVLSSGRAHVSPTRYLTWAICSSVEQPDLPPVVFAGSHYVSGAFTNPGQLGDDDGWRITAWAEDFDGTAAKVREWVAAGLTVVFGADTNAPTPHMDRFTPDQVWVVDDRGLDKIAVCPGVGGVDVTPSSVDRWPLNSDHDLRVMNARITPPSA